MRPARIAVGFIVGPPARQVCARDDRSGALELRDSKRRLAAVLPRNGSRTAKPSADDRRRVPHHLIDVRNPDDSLDVAEFAQLARAAIENIAARGRNPLVVGGSGLYLRVIRGGIFRARPHHRKFAIDWRKSRRSRASRTCISGCAISIPSRRIESASTTCTASCARSKFFELTGERSRPIRKGIRFADIGYDTLTIGIEVERKKALRRYRRALRRDGRSRSGRRSARAYSGWILAREAAAQYDWIQTNRVVSARRDALADAIALAKQESRRLAKRQLTWFRREPEIVWLDPERGADDALALFEKFFQA